MTSNLEGDSLSTEIKEPLLEKYILIITVLIKIVKCLKIMRS